MPTLTPVTYDPFAKGAPRLTPVDRNPFETKHPEAAALAVDPGARVTSTERSARHNRDVGGVPNSRHLTGDAVDFLPGQGRTRAQDVAAIRARDPHPKELLDEGDHIHYSPGKTPTYVPVDKDPFAPKGMEAFDGPQVGKGVMKPPEPTVRGALRPATPAKPEAPDDPLTRRYREGRGQVGEGLRRMQAPNDPTQIIPGALEAMGGGWNAITAAPATLIDKTYGRAIAKATENAPHGEHYDLRIPENFVGDTAVTLSGFLPLGPKGVREPRIPEETTYRPGETTGPPKRGVRKPQEPPAAAAATMPPARAGKPVPAPRLTPVDGDPFKGPVKTIAAAVEHDSGTELRDDRGVVGSEPDPTTRVDNALYRLGGHATAGKIEAMDTLRSVPKEVSNPKVQEELYHAIEQQMVDPKAKVPEHLKAAEEARAPWAERQRSAVNRIRERLAEKGLTDGEIEKYLPETGYVPRRRAGFSPSLDPRDPGAGGRDPFAGKRSLTKTTSSLKARTQLVLVDENGKRSFVRNPDKEWKPGMTIRGSFDRPMRVAQATTKEIEAAGAVDSKGRPITYHKNALVNTVDEALHAERVERNMQVLDEITKGGKEEGWAHQDEWHYKNEDGQWVRQGANTPRPEGFVELPHIPQLKGWSFEPKIAEALKDWNPGPEEPVDGLLTKASRLLTASLFATPFPHAANVMNHWIVGRGWDWLPTAGNTRRLAQTSTRAVREVLTMGPRYQRFLKEGSGLLYGDTATRNFHQFMMEKAGAELTSDPQTWKALSKAFALGQMTPVDFVKMWYRTSQKALWAAGDVFMLQRQMELEAKGMPTREAIREAERDIPNYRIPPQVMKSRALAQIMKDPKYLMFGRYKYGQIKAWGEMFKDLMGPKSTPQQRLDAVGKFLVAAITAGVVYPMADAILKKATGNKDARVKRSGAFSIPDAAYRFSTGQIDFATAMGSIVTPSPIGQEVLEDIGNRDEFTGKHIIEPQSSTAGKTAQAIERASGSIYPAQLAIDASKPGGAPGAAGKLVGLDIPPPDRAEKRRKAIQMEKSRARSRDRRDPLTQRLEGMFR